MNFVTLLLFDVLSEIGINVVDTTTVSNVNTFIVATVVPN